MKVFFLFAIVGLSCSVSKGQTNQDIDAVKRVVLAFQEDFNDGRFKNAVTYTTTDWRHINPGGGIDKGRDSVLKSVRAVHQAFLKGVGMRIESMDIRFITLDVAIADVIHRMDQYSAPDGSKRENERQIKTYVIIKKKGKWLLTQDHNTIIQESNTTPNQK
jgi:uncharacterized protein (TIGR02246 family)